MNSLSNLKREPVSQASNNPTVLNTSNGGGSPSPVQNRGGGDASITTSSQNVFPPFPPAAVSPPHAQICRSVNGTSAYQQNRNDYVVRNRWSQPQQQSPQQVQRLQQSSQMAYDVLQQNGGPTPPPPPIPQPVSSYHGHPGAAHHHHHHYETPACCYRDPAILNNPTIVDAATAYMIDAQQQTAAMHSMNRNVSQLLNYTNGSPAGYQSTAGLSSPLPPYISPYAGNTNSSSPGNYMLPPAPPQSRISSPQSSLQYQPPVPPPVVFGPPPRDRNRPAPPLTQQPALPQAMYDRPTLADQQLSFRHAGYGNMNNATVPRCSVSDNQLMQFPGSTQIKQNNSADSAWQSQRNLIGNFFKPDVQTYSSENQTLPMMLNKYRKNVQDAATRICDSSMKQTDNANAECSMNPIKYEMNGHVDVTNSSPALIITESNFSQSSRQNMKLKFSKNVVNIPKKIENVEERRSDSSSSSNDSKTLYTDNSSDASISSNNKCMRNRQTNDLFENQVQFESADKMITLLDYVNNNRTAELNGNCYEVGMNEVITDEQAFINVIVDGCLKGEEIATKYQNIPCFKNIKNLCEKTRNDVKTPHCTVRNIHSQGVPWATKDYIFAFTRLTSCWYLLKGYLGEHSDIFEKIEQLYSPGLRSAFDAWEATTWTLAYHVMKSFAALANNNSARWHPRAHSTPVSCEDIHQAKRKTEPPPDYCTMSNFPINESTSEMQEQYLRKASSEIHILSRNSMLNEQLRSAEFFNYSKSRSSNSFNNSSLQLNDSFLKNCRVEIAKLTPETIKYFANQQNCLAKYRSRPFKQISQDLDSGDDEKYSDDYIAEYIKPGCYPVPEIIEPTPPTRQISPASFIQDPDMPIISSPLYSIHSISSQSSSGGRLSKYSSTPNEQKQRCRTGFRRTSHHSDDENVPFKHTPQGRITSALIKRSREEFPIAPNILLRRENRQDQSAPKQNNDECSNTNESQTSGEFEFSKLETTQRMPGGSINKVSFAQFSNSIQEINEAYAVKSEPDNLKPTVERHSECSVEIKDSESADIATSSRNVEFENGTDGNVKKRQYRNSEKPVAAIKKGLVINTRKRAEFNDRKCVRSTPAYKNKRYYNGMNGLRTLMPSDDITTNSIVVIHKNKDDSDVGDTSYQTPDIVRTQETQDKEQFANFIWSVWYCRKRQGLSRLAVETFEQIVSELWSMPNSHYFIFEVDMNNAPDYYQIVKHPMFIENILQKLKTNKYSNLHQVVRDFRKTFKNATNFVQVHPDKELETLILKFAETFEHLLEEKFPQISFKSVTLPTKDDDLSEERLEGLLSPDSSEQNQQEKTNVNSQNGDEKGVLPPSK